MKGKSRVKNIMHGMCMAVLVMGLFWSCSTFNLSRDGWEVVPDVKKELLTISHEKLGVIVKDVQLALKGDDSIDILLKWTVKKGKDGMVISTEEPSNTEWIFKTSEKTLDISCSTDNAVLCSLAPASEGRIPARIESQDNGIMYTSLGFVSSKNIYSLFDRETDIMIQFPEGSDFRRSVSDQKLMDVTFPVDADTDISLIPDYYIDVLGLKYYKPAPERFEKAPVGWCSWYCYYMGTTEEDMVKETDALAHYLKPYGLEYVQLDACFTRGEEANYLDWTKKTFPKGGKWILQYIKEKGLKPGLWVNVYGSNYAHPECAEKYPENYFLRDKEGNLSGACCTADNTVVRLDYTNPEVIEKHLKPMFKILKEDWGLEYIKDAGWGTWMDYYDENKENAFDPARGSSEVYREVQDALRETLGPDVYITGCAMHEVGLGFGVFDGSRIGGDDRAVWYPEKEGGMSMQIYFNSIFGGNYLNNITWHSDPDTVMVRNPLTMEEARTIVTTIALTGELYMASDFIGKLPEKRLDLYRKTMPSTRVVPIDLYPYKIKSNRKNGVVWSCPYVKEYPRVLDLKVNAESGVYDVVAVYNWANEEDTKTVFLGEDLGLDTTKEYLIFDFWNQKIKEFSNDEVTSLIPSHGTHVYVIRPVLERPQFLASSRHVTGAVSIKSLEWDSSKSILSGCSEIVKGAPYSLFVHVPEGFNVSQVDADTEVLFHKITDGILEVKFAGDFESNDQKTVNWKVLF